MEIFEIDNRSKEDIIKQIQNISKSYVPQWRFDTENPDIGTSLALVYAELFSKTIKQLNKVTIKNKVAFFNSIDAKLLPAMPSFGYVTFGMVNREVEGVEVPAGLTVIAEPQDKTTGNIPFETLDNLYATPAQINHIFQVTDRHDYISHVYKDENKEINFCLFNHEEENLQKHIMYFGHKDAFNIKKDADIELNIYTRSGNLLSEEFVKALLDEEKACFEYYTEDGFVEFSEKSEENGKIFLKNKNNAEFHMTEIERTDNYWIRCTIKDIKPFVNLSFEKFTIKSKGMYIKPQLISGNGIECNQWEYFPFGEKMGIYTEAYFASDEVLCKKKALVQMSFSMNFVKIALETEEESQEIQWNWVMKRSDFKVEPEYDITIAEVLWEYYNGNGWSRLFEDNSYYDIFTTEQGMENQFRSIKFVCPNDIEPILIHAKESYYIRVRIIKMNNAFKTRGNYITPVLSETYFHYEYPTEGVTPEYIYIQNNLETVLLKDKELMKERLVKPFVGTGEEKSAIYFGFNTAPIGGPIKMLITLSEIRTKLPGLMWEYLTEERWENLKIIDETEGLRKTGLITFMGKSNFAKKKKFGKELYWIRITDETDYYINNKQKKQVWVTGIHMNTVKVLSVKSNNIEFFSMKQYKENAEFKLLDSNLYDIEVWVNEAGYLSSSEVAELERKGDVQIINNDFGSIEEAWVSWKEVSDFGLSSKTDRHFTADKIEGKVIFGNGKYSRIPPTSAEENIKIIYRSGGGENHNVNVGEIKKLSQTIGFINSVTNMGFTSGGCDKELITDSMRRNASALRHRDRAVSARDFEDLALEASRGIIRAECFSGYNEKGEKASGFVTLVILQKDFNKEQDFFYTVKEEVYSYLRERTDPNLIKSNRFAVIKPEFIEVCVRIEVSVKNLQQVFQVRNMIVEKLNAFLNPIEGNFNGKGWRIGEFPNIIQIKNAILNMARSEVQSTKRNINKDMAYNMESIFAIEHLSILVYSYEDSKKIEIDMEEVERSKYVLPLNGIHEVLVF